MRRLSKRRFARFLRGRPTVHESLLWKELQSSKAGVGFLRQVPIHGWIADFLSKDARLIIEVDGRAHGYGKQLLKDLVRDKVLWKAGFRTLRFTNKEVEQELPAVVSAIKRVAKERLGG